MLNGLSGVPRQQFQTTLDNALNELRSNSPPRLTRMVHSRARTDSAYASQVSSRTASSSSPLEDDVIVLDDDEEKKAKSAQVIVPSGATMPANGMNPAQMNAIRDFYSNLVRSGQTQPQTANANSGQSQSLLGQLLAQ